MANTLTYNPGEEEGLSSDEQDSLKVGEQLEEAQQQLLAGKFRDADQLEKAYLELQSKFSSGNRGDESSEESSETDTGNDDQVSPDNEPTNQQEEEVTATSVVTNASDEWFKEGKLSDQTMESLQSMSSQDLINAYIEAYGENSAPTVDLTDQQVNTIKNDVGGPEAFDQVLTWANENLDPAYVQSYDNLVETGNFQAIQMALAGIKSAYDAANGYEGRMLTGKAVKQDTNVFRSQAEVVQAMNDPRYDKDPAFRNDVFAKLERSNLQF